MSFLTGWLDKNVYPNFAKNWDDVLFRQLIEQRLSTSMTVLDVGAGAGIVSQMNFRGRVARICGIDPDERVTQNPYLDEGRTSMGENVPYPDGTFDLAFADNVLEHLADPTAVFGEIARVLKPNGQFLFKTPNAWHYMPVIAQMTPHRFHRRLNKMRGRDESDTFPTLYRANTPSTVAQHANAAGLMLEHYALIEGRPEYLRMTTPTYVAGIAYEKLVNHVPFLAPFRILLMGTLRKPG